MNRVKSNARVPLERQTETTDTDKPQKRAACTGRYIWQALQSHWFTSWAPRTCKPIKGTIMCMLHVFTARRFQWFLSVALVGLGHKRTETLSVPFIYCLLAVFVLTRFWGLPECSLVKWSWFGDKWDVLRLCSSLEGKTPPHYLASCVLHYQRYRGESVNASIVGEEWRRNSSLIQTPFCTSQGRFCPHQRLVCHWNFIQRSFLLSHVLGLNSAARN